MHFLLLYPLYICRLSVQHNPFKGPGICESWRDAVSKPALLKRVKLTRIFPLIVHAQIGEMELVRSKINQLEAEHIQMKQK